MTCPGQKEGQMMLENEGRGLIVQVFRTAAENSSVSLGRSFLSLGGHCEYRFPNPPMV